MHSRKSRNVQFIQELPQFRDRAGKFSAGSDQRHRPLGFFQQRDQRVAKRRLSLSVGRARLRRELYRTSEFHLRFEEVCRDINHYRPGTSFARPMKGFGHRSGNFFNRTHQTAPFGTGKRQSKDVSFLERVSADQSAADLASDTYQRHRIHLGVRYPGYKICCTWTAGGDGHANLSRRPSMSLGSEHRTLLMTRKNMANAAAFKRVIQGHDCAARVTEHQVHSLGAQTLQKDFGSPKHSRPFLPRQARPWWLACRNPFAAMTSCCAGSLPLPQPGASSRPRAKRQTSFRQFYSRQSTHARTYRPECQQESSSSRRGSRRQQLSDRESGPRTRRCSKSSSACDPDRPRKSDRRSASFRECIRSRQSQAGSQPRSAFQILSSSAKSAPRRALLVRQTG